MIRWSLVVFDTKLFCCKLFTSEAFIFVVHQTILRPRERVLILSNYLIFLSQFLDCLLYDVVRSLLSLILHLATKSEINVITKNESIQNNYSHTEFYIVYRKLKWVQNMFFFFKKKRGYLVSIKQKCRRIRTC